MAIVKPDIVVKPRGVSKLGLSAALGWIANRREERAPAWVLRVWHRWMRIGLSNRSGEIVTRGPLQFVPLVYRLESRCFKPMKRARHPYGAPICRDAGVATDPPLKRRSARERRARSNRAPGAIFLIGTNAGVAQRESGGLQNRVSVGSIPTTGAKFANSSA